MGVTFRKSVKKRGRGVEELISNKRIGQVPRQEHFPGHAGAGERDGGKDAV